MKKIIPAFLLLSVIALASCLGKGNGREEPVRHVGPDEFQSLIVENPGYLLLDVRTPGEYDAGHIPGSVLIPVQELAGRIDEITQYKDSTVLVYCRSGNRSRSAASILVDNGFTDIVNLDSGFNSWAAGGFPSE